MENSKNMVVKCRNPRL